MAYQTTYGPDGRLRVAILGCTGSIGTQALDVCRQHADRLQVTALSVNSSTPELVAAPREFSVPAVAVADASRGADAVLQELPDDVRPDTIISINMIKAMPLIKRLMLRLRG